MKRLCACVLVLALAPLGDRSSGADKAPSAKDALRELNDFIGDWSGNGAPAKPKPASKELWTESASWGWRFKGDDTWLTLTIGDGKYHKSGELRYLPDKKRYQLTLTDKSDKKQVFEGALDKGYLRLERNDAEKKETHRLSFNNAAEGIRLIALSERKPEGRTVFVKEYQVEYTKKGESLASAKKKQECVVSGGLGTMAVSFKGETFYVCCTGCRDAFNENPQKYIDEFRASKAGKKN